MAPTGNGKSTAPQFVGVVGIAFVLVLLLFAGTLGIRRCLPGRSKKYSREPERGLPVAEEISPLLPAPIAVPSPPEDYQQAADYGATALSPSPADKRETLHNREAQNKDTLQLGMEKAKARDEAATAGTAFRPTGSTTHAHSESVAKSARQGKNESNKTSRRHSVGGGSTHSYDSASEQFFGAPTSFAHAKHAGWHWGSGGGGGGGESSSSSSSPDSS